MKAWQAWVTAGLVIAVWVEVSPGGHQRAEAEDAYRHLDYAESRLRNAEWDLSYALEARDAALQARSNAAVNLDAAVGASRDVENQLASIAAAAADLAAQRDAAAARIEELNTHIDTANTRHATSIERVNAIVDARVKAFEASPKHAAAVDAIQQIEWRLDRLFPINDVFAYLIDLGFSLPPVPGESIMRSSIAEHEAAVAHLESMRDAFERELDTDPELQAADAVVRADAVHLNALTAELKEAQSNLESHNAQLQDTEQSLLSQRDTLNVIYADIDGWQSQVSQADSAIHAAEQRVQYAASDVAAARDYRDDAARHLRWIIEQPEPQIVIIPNHGSRFRHDDDHGRKGHGRPERDESDNDGHPDRDKDHDRRIERDINTRRPEPEPRIDNPKPWRGPTVDEPRERSGKTFRDDQEKEDSRRDEPSRQNARAEHERRDRERAAERERQLNEVQRDRERDEKSRDDRSSDEGPQRERKERDRAAEQDRAQRERENRQRESESSERDRESRRQEQQSNRDDESRRSSDRPREDRGKRYER